MSDLLAMSDEDFLKLNEPGPAPANDGAAPVVVDGNETRTTETQPNAGAITEVETQEKADDLAGSDGADADAGKDGDETGAAGLDAAATGTVAAPGSEAGKAGETKDLAAADAGNKPAGEADPKPDGAKAVTEEIKPVDYEGFFKEVMKPFKANGKTVEPRSPEEVIRLMQMGAGFGRKLQDMQPHIKTLRMLEKENLLDPNELSYLIDLRNKNPDAIKKLIKESNIDPLDLNMEDNVDYKPVNRSVSDAEVAFEDALVNLKDRPTGNETIQHINQTWDKESLALLWDQPGLLEVFQDQRENGIYDKIVAEISHQKTFGKIAPNTPFIRAYTIAGDALAKSGGLKPSSKEEPAPVAETLKPAHQPQVIGTRVQTPKPVVANSDKAKAAESTQSSARKASAIVNPLSMPDDVFMKTFEGRL